MDMYLVEIKDLGGADLRLLRGLTELTRFLSDNIASEHYSADGYIVQGVWRWNGDGDMSELSLESRPELPGEDDWLYWRYEIREADPSIVTPVTSFTVRIDGRA